MEGCLAKFRYHSRALSPIHVRVDCEKGPPLGTNDLIVDNQCYQMQLLLWLSVQTPAAIQIMSNKKWLHILLNVINDGTHRLKQCAIRILRVLIPNVSPSVLETTFMNLPDDRVNVSGVAFINAFLDFVGLAVWPKIHGAVKANNLIVKKRDDQRLAWTKVCSKV